MERMRWVGLVIVTLAACGRLDFDTSNATADAGPGVVQVQGPGVWIPTAAPPLAARVWTNAIWSGREFVVFGGALDAAYSPTDTGARYDPMTQTWTPTSLIGTPGARHTAKMVLVDGTIVQYGGGSNLNSVAGGGRYDPSTDTWSGMATSPPDKRIYASTAAIGSRMIVWGGWTGSAHLGTGFVYDPSLDQWTPMSATGAPSLRSFATAIWTGSKLIVWGGCAGGMPSCGQLKGDGAIYDPVADTWTPMASAGAPIARAQHVAVWTGTEMIVFGGHSLADEGGPLGDGAIYTPATDSWRPISTTNAPGPRVDPAGVWMQTKMLIWGGDLGQSDGALYDPVTDEWTALAIAGAPTLRQRFAFAANETQFFVWGGSFSETSGAIWTPLP